VSDHGNSRTPYGDPERWQRRAEEARTMADHLIDPEAKRYMSKIAEDYEKISLRARANGHFPR